MNRRVLLGAAAMLVLVALVLLAGAYAYNMGLAQGALQNAQIVVPDPGEGVVPVHPYYAMPFYRFGPGFGPWGFGFGPLGCLFPLLGFFLLLALFNIFARFVFGGYGPRGWGRHAPLDEWHRRAHEAGTSSTPE